MRGWRLRGWRLEDRETGKLDSGDWRQDSGDSDLETLTFPVPALCRVVGGCYRQGKGGAA